MKSHRLELVLVIGMTFLLGGMIVSYPPVNRRSQEEATVQDDDAPFTDLGSVQLPNSPIDLDRAQATALEGRPDAVVVGVEFERDDGAWGYEFELDSGIEVKIDASTGDVLKTETPSGLFENEEDSSGMDQESND